MAALGHIYIFKGLRDYRKFTSGHYLVIATPLVCSVLASMNTYVSTCFSTRLLAGATTVDFFSC